MTDVEFAIAAAGALMIVSTWRFTHRFVPWVYGASLTGILWGDESHDEPAPFWTIIVRLLTPLMYGVLAAVIRPGMDATALLLMGGLAGLLVCWPNILEPYRMPPALWPRKEAVFVVYAMFASLCALATFVGGRTAGYLLGTELEELSGFGVTIAGGLILAFLLWVVKVAWATRDVHGHMWEYEE